MMRLYTDPSGVQVLVFESTEEARSVGRHLAEMGDGCRYYARGDDTIPAEKFTEVLSRVKSPAPPPPKPPPPRTLPY